MEGEARRPPACVSKVLDDDDLLTEIIVRVGFPTTLVRAACVCKRWLSHASDRAFLCRFRELHPPTLLGFYIVEWGYPAAARFFPILPQPPELAAVVHRANFSEGLPFSKKEGDTMVGCSNGSVFTRRLNFTSCGNFDLDTYELVFAVHSPLCYEGGYGRPPRITSQNALLVQLGTSQKRRRGRVVLLLRHGGGPGYHGTYVKCLYFGKW
ncbi:uncharacterized protein [Triticum aestivum]|uniref:uncharacterized protein n=1 Tax=Triticum aestivum TaxID=4565 RepID=UPI001D033C15|nr:uncharacterized protein LOC123063279 [Triticum aestivum]